MGNIFFGIMRAVFLVFIAFVSLIFITSFLADVSPNIYVVLGLSFSFVFIFPLVLLFILQKAFQKSKFRFPGPSSACNSIIILNLIFVCCCAFIFHKHLHRSLQYNGLWLFEKASSVYSLDPNSLVIKTGERMLYFIFESLPFKDGSNFRLSKTTNPVLKSFTPVPLPEEQYESTDSSSISKQRIKVIYEKIGNIILLEAVINNGIKGKFLFDTGASFTTISSKVARQLKIQVMPHNPKIQFHTANGIKEHTLVILDSLNVNGAEVKGLTAGICDQCGDKNSIGLIGLNFANHFIYTINDEERQIIFSRRKHRYNQKNEIQPFVKFLNIQAVRNNNFLRLSFTLKNTTAWGIRNLTISALSGGEPKALLCQKEIRKLPPFHAKDLQVLCRPNPTRTFTLELSRARWDKRF